MRIRSMGLGLALAIAISACTANVNTAPPVSGGGGGTTARDAVVAVEADADVRALGSLRTYRTETPLAADATRMWIVYFFAPSSGKSYQCTFQEGQDVVVREVTGNANLAYKQGYDIERSEWQVDSEQAKTKAKQVVNVNVTNVNVTYLRLVSAAEFQALTGQTSSAPVWVCKVQGGGTGASPSPAMSPTASPSMSPSASPTMSPSASPTASATMSPSASPTATASPAGDGGNTVINQTNNYVFINANTGNQIAVNTGTQIDTNIDMTMGTR